MVSRRCSSNSPFLRRAMKSGEIKSSITGILLSRIRSHWPGTIAWKDYRPTSQGIGKKHPRYENNDVPPDYDVFCRFHGWHRWSCAAVRGTMGGGGLERRDMIWLHEHNPDYPDPSNPPWWRWWLLLRWPSSWRWHRRNPSISTHSLVLFR